MLNCTKSAAQILTKPHITANHPPKKAIPHYMTEQKKKKRRKNNNQCKA